MLRGLFLSAIFHFCLLLSFAYILPYFMQNSSILEISVDIISEEILKPDIVQEKSVEKPKEKVEQEKPKKSPEPEEPKKDDKIRQIQEIATKEKPFVEEESEKIEQDKKEPKDPSGLIDDLSDSDSDKLDDILNRIRQAQESETERQKAIGSGPLTTEEVGLIKRQVNSCWFNMYGRVFDETDLNNIEVKIYVALDESGNVVDIRPIENVESYMDLDNHLYRKILDSAVHSFIACKKIQNLPKTKYKYWKEFEFSFKPSDAF